MKKFVLLLGIILLLIAGVMYFTDVGAERVSLNVNEEVTVEGMSSLDVKTTSADIVFRSTTEEKLSVTLEGTVKKDGDNQEIDVTEKDGNLEVTYVPDSKLGVNLVSKNVTLVIEIPENAFETLNVRSTSGDIDGVALTTDTVMIESTSGSHTLEGFTATTVSLAATSGNIELGESTIEDLSIESTSGSIEVDRLTATSGEIEATSGDVTLVTEEESETFEIETTSGSVEVIYSKKPTDLEITFDGNSGEADSSLKDLLYKEKEENEFHGVIGEATNKLVVETTSGDFSVK
ncbi:DUF4097 family beta strand repeat-containing protein [Alkalihalobacillus sp. CinArs1]|uniref:DUF4097 family beta strand repeat-containing protein n=1 Tax=Alkalihalobacillus sp. CinArs1 TaxID=2995314 RepID=UPI0022DDE189|nr:DUF4097 family beta strand repeat-containing protein [Alkalihalobacillus sp. CinArs1]